MRPQNLKCPNCGDNLHLLIDLGNNSAVRPPYWLKDLSYRDEREGVCFSCKQRSIPMDLPDDEMHDQARKFREELDFAAAVSEYNNIINENSKDAEAYWFRALSRQEIAGGHGVGDKLCFYSVPSTKHLQEDGDFEKACECSIDASRREEFKRSAASIDAVRDAYMDIKRKRNDYQVYLCSSPMVSDRASELLATFNEEEIVAFSGVGGDAEICFARNSAKVMIVLGTPDEAMKQQISFFDRHAKDDRDLHLMFATSVSDKSFSENSRWCDLSATDWKSQILDFVRIVYPKQQENVTIVQETVNVIQDDHTTDSIDHAYNCFLKKDFKSAKESADRVLQNGVKNIPCMYVKAFFHTYVENTSNRNAIDIFFKSTKNIKLNADDVLKMKNLFLTSMYQVKDYEEDILRMLINSEVGTNGMCAFVDSFSAKLIPKQAGIGFLTEGLLGLYVDLAKTNNIPKTCLALMSAVNTNQDSPVPQNDFHLKTKTETFYRKYFIPISAVIGSMKDATLQRKFMAVYNNELKKFEAKKLGR